MDLGQCWRRPCGDHKKLLPFKIPHGRMTISFHFIAANSAWVLDKNVNANTSNNLPAGQRNATKGSRKLRYLFFISEVRGSSSGLSDPL